LNIIIIELGSCKWVLRWAEGRAWLAVSFHAQFPFSWLRAWK